MIEVTYEAVFCLAQDSKHGHLGSTELAENGLLNQHAYQYAST